MLQQGITYNTTMGLAAGAIMLLLVVFARVVQQPQRNSSLEGWAWMFIALGLILAVTGTHMTLTWPLEQIEGAPCCAVDNVAFGEPAMLFGFLVVCAGIALIRGEKNAFARGIEFDIFVSVRPILYAGAFGGIGLIMIGIAGIQFGMWGPPPPDEPIARLMGDSIIERFYVAGAYVVTGIAAMTAAFASEHRIVGRVFAGSTLIGGMSWTFLAITLFYGHIGFFPFPD